MFAIYKREMRSYFTTPIGYVFLAVFLAVNAVIFAMYTYMADTASISNCFTAMIYAYILLVPILTMKTFSDELRLKTDQLLLTAPVSLTKVVFAKFLSALTVYFIAVATSMLNFLFLAFHNYSAAGGIVLGLFLSMLLIGMACIAIGIFISSLTESQLVAVLLSMVVLAVASISHYLASLISIPWLRTFLSYFAIGGRYSYLAGGQFDFSAILYYLSISGVFLLLTIRVFERKRWH